MIRTYRTLILAGLLISACSDDARDTNTTGDEVEGNRPLVITSNYPLHYIATRIIAGIDGGPLIVLPKFDGDPAMWLPTAAQIQQMQEADLILINGAGAEPWLDLVTLPAQQLRDTTYNIRESLIRMDETVVHQHGPEGEHSHKGTAFTTWLDPVLLAKQATYTADALTMEMPQFAAEYQNNLELLIKDLSGLDERLREAFDLLGDQRLLFSHPVYQYLERRYGLNGISLHWEPGEEPGLNEWVGLQRILASESITLMIWEDEPLVAISDRLAELGVVPIPWYTAGNLPESGDFLTLMSENADRLETELQAQQSRLPD